MSKKLLPTLVLALGSLAVSGCEEVAQPQSVVAAPAAPSTATRPAPQPDQTPAPVAATPEPETVGGFATETATEPPTPIATGAAAPLYDPESNCLMAVTAQSGVSEVSTVSVTSGASGSTVLVKVSGTELPWRCTTDAFGSISEVASME